MNKNSIDMNEKYKINQGDCLEKLKELEDNSVDAIVTDPPYELGFMGKKWDSSGITYNIEMWKECYRVLKPGAYLLSFGGTRTYHRMACAIEDAGFEIRDCIYWCYGSGFPKSQNLGKMYDKKFGNEREIIGRNPNSREKCSIDNTLYKSGTVGKTDYISKGNSLYEGMGTSLKPAHEPILMARKPLSEKTIIDNVIKWGTGGINIDECRIPIDMSLKNVALNPLYRFQNKDKYRQPFDTEQRTGEVIKFTNSLNPPSKFGRFPANLIWTHHPNCVETDEWILNKGQKAGDRTKTFGNETSPISGGEGSGGSMNNSDGYVKKWICVEGCPSKEFEKVGNCGAFAPVKMGQKGFGGVIYGKYNTSGDDGKSYYNDGLGSPSRFFISFSYGEEDDFDFSPFFYCAKASKREREEGLEGMETKIGKIIHNRYCKICGKQEVSGSPCKCEVPIWEIISKERTHKNFHPTVKPIKLMSYLIKLITPKKGVVLDPFMGSGSTGVACMKLDRKFIGIELTEEYIPIAETRIKYAIPTQKQKKLEE